MAPRQSSKLHSVARPTQDCSTLLTGGYPQVSSRQSAHHLWSCVHPETTLPSRPLTMQSVDTREDPHIGTLKSQSSLKAQAVKTHAILFRTHSTPPYQISITPIVNLSIFVVRQRVCCVVFSFMISSSIMFDSACLEGTKTRTGAVEIIKSLEPIERQIVTEMVLNTPRSPHPLLHQLALEG